MGEKKSWKSGWGIGVRVRDYQSPGFIIKGLAVKMTFEKADIGEGQGIHILERTLRHHFSRWLKQRQAFRGGWTYI